MFNAVNRYGAKERWTDLERWGNRLKAVADAWQEDQEIQLAQAKGAVSAILGYGGKGRSPDLERWRARLAAVARAHPGNLGIQDLASKMGLGYADQMHSAGQEARR